MKMSLQMANLLLAAFFLSACATDSAYSPLLRAEPEMGATLTRAPRTLRLYYDALPDVDQSSLRLTGPEGEQELRGLHTMAADDLMVEIMGALGPGEYAVEWSTVVGDNPAVHSGSFGFTVVDANN